MLIFVISIDRIIMIKLHRVIILVLCLSANVALWAQPTNSSCNTALTIPDPTSFCSGSGEYNNTSAGPGNPAYGVPACFSSTTVNDVWFRFTAFANTVTVVVNGNTLSSPQVALYEDNGCVGTISELRCASDAGIGFGSISLTRGGLTIGQSYLIRVDGVDNGQGTFQLCITNFNPPVAPGQDCNTGAILCDKSDFSVSVLSGPGAITNEFVTPCNSGMPNENETVWFKWTCDQAGSLTFTLDPLNPGEDLDFAVYEMTQGVNSCVDLMHLRCALNSPGLNLECGDLTGIALASLDTQEDPNCEPNQEDGFVRSIDMTSGTSYALIIDNFTNSGIGFEIEWGGTGTFLGPVADFTIEPQDGLRCDTFFTVTDISSFSNGNIIGYEWNFGEGAVPQTHNTATPPPIIYNSFGEKFITLTIEVDQGCIITKVLPLFVEPCCDDLMIDIDLNLVEVVDLLCATIPDGSITVAGSGSPPPAEYQYSIDGGPFTLNPFFGNLDQGTYQINTIDLKGCEDSITVVVNAPPPILVDAGADQTVDLGFDAQLNGTYTPQNFGDSIIWSTLDTADLSSLSCLDCLDPVVMAPGKTTYYLTIVDALGCSSTDSVTICVNLEYPVYGPTIFSPNDDGLNDLFNVFTGPAAEEIENLYIYDRWGELIYHGEGLTPNDPNQGWDGRFKNDRLNNQVFAWLAEVRFIDDVVLPFAGSVTLAR